MSKRSMVLTAIALIMVVAAVLSVYLEKREIEKIYEETDLDLEPETKKPEKQADKKKAAEILNNKKVSEPEKQPDNGTETTN